MSDERRLLQSYVETGSRYALHQLVQRNLGLVYSSALRQLRDPHQAEDVTQAVFVILAQKARTIRDGTTIGGWLLAVTRFVAITAMRKQAIRQKHEQLAARSEVLEPAGQGWEGIAPVLDAELNRLRRIDRDAIVLRFIQDRSFEEIGIELGVSEEAARKRVTRALEQLRARLGGRTSAAVLSSAIGAYAAYAVPTRLSAQTIVATVRSATPHCISLAKGGVQMMAWAKAKLFGAVTASVLIGSTGTSIVTHSIMLQRSVEMADERRLPEKAERPATTSHALPAAPQAPAILAESAQLPAPPASPLPAQSPSRAAEPVLAGPHGQRGNETAG